MTDWAFETWPRILLGASTLALLFAILHVMAGVVTGMGTAVNQATGVLAAMAMVGYLVIGDFHHRNPSGDGE